MGPPSGCGQPDASCPLEYAREVRGVRHSMCADHKNTIATRTISKSSYQKLLKYRVFIVPGCPERLSGRGAFVADPATAAARARGLLRGGEQGPNSLLATFLTPTASQHGADQVRDDAVSEAGAADGGITRHRSHGARYAAHVAGRLTVHHYFHPAAAHRAGGHRGGQVHI